MHVLVAHVSPPVGMPSCGSRGMISARLTALWGMCLQIGMSDKTILKDFHPDAEDLYNVTMDLSTVCMELRDRNKRMPRRVMCATAWHIHFTRQRPYSACIYSDPETYTFVHTASML